MYVEICGTFRKATSKSLTFGGSVSLLSSLSLFPDVCNVHGAPEAILGHEVTEDASMAQNDHGSLGPWPPPPFQLWTAHFQKEARFYLVILVVSDFLVNSNWSANSMTFCVTNSQCIVRLFKLFFVFICLDLAKRSQWIWRLVSCKVKSQTQFPREGQELDWKGTLSKMPIGSHKAVPRYAARPHKGMNRAQQYTQAQEQEVVNHHHPW